MDGKPSADTGFLFYGDNLPLLREYFNDEMVDLVYLDPPFKSDQSYNVLFKEHDGTQAAAQLQAFGDTWRWDQGSEDAYQQVVEAGGRVSETLQAFRTFLKTSDMMAYLAMMAPRLIELHRVLKRTGALYLHCDQTASHYLKLLLDAVFDPVNFRNEITWKRKLGTSSAVHTSNRFGTATDSILFYVKSEEARFAPQYNRKDPDYQKYVDEHFTHTDPDGRKYQADNLANPAPRPNLMYEYKGYKPPRNGWAISKAKMEQWDREGRLHFPATKDGRIRRKRYADELKGMPIQNLWTDIDVLSSHSAERLGYPTQKPRELLERIISASSKEGDVVLDPFCGCGTTIDAAQHLKRRWIGIDITYAAISVIRNRFKRSYGIEISNVVGAPVTVQDAATLAQSDPYQFQWWALDLVAARPAEQKKGADKGVDGRLYCHEFDGGPTKQVIFSVKGGAHIVPAFVSELRGVIEREKAAVGVLITMHRPTRAMRVEAAQAGFYQSPWGKHPRLQILTIEQLLAGEGIDYPPARQAMVKYKPTPVRASEAEQLGLFERTKPQKVFPGMAKSPLFDAPLKRKKRA